MPNSADPGSQLIWILIVCRGRAYPGSAGQGLKSKPLIWWFLCCIFFNHAILIFFLFLYEKVFCRHSLEVPHQGINNMFSWIRKFYLENPARAVEVNGVFFLLSYVCVETYLLENSFIFGLKNAPALESWAQLLKASLA